MKNSFLNLEFALVKFPIFFPILYGVMLYSFPQFETYILFFTILLLAETHFGATWPFFLHKSNKQFIKENKFHLIAFPVSIIILSLLGYFFFKKFFLLIFFAANMYHVTRQSFGVCKLYTKNETEKNYQEIFIYSINILFFLIGYLRFYLPFITADNLIILNIIVLSVIVTMVLIYYIKFKSNNFFTFITGLLIFYPICFVDNPVHAIVMGVTMHYTQYLYLTHKVYKGRKKNNLALSSGSYYLMIILFYSIAMTSLSIFAKSTNEILSILIIIPIIGQMLHFYLDSQLWKFSNVHNRNNVLSFLRD